MYVLVPIPFQNLSLAPAYTYTNPASVQTDVDKSYPAGGFIALYPGVFMGITIGAVFEV